MEWYKNQPLEFKDVWRITTQSYKDAHFATFPERIPELCIKAGTSEWGCCPECGAPWERVVEKGALIKTNYDCGNTQPNQTGKDHIETEVETLSHGRTKQGHIPGHQRETTTKGFQPTCECDTGDPIPCTVLDPFAGSGTTLKVARDLGRSAIGIDISAEYKKLAVERARLHTRDILSYKEAEA